MARLLITFVLGLVPMLMPAQETRPFDVTLDNDEYKIYMRLNLYDKNLTVPGQDVLGEVDGYIASRQSRTTWLVVGSEIVDAKTARLEVVNDYGSEDFTAELKLNSDGTYSYKKKDGSTLKFAVRGKWQKLPGSLEFVRK